MFLILEVVINSFSSTLRFDFKTRKIKPIFSLNSSFNQVDLQKILDPEFKKMKKKFGLYAKYKEYHHSKFVKQFCYYTIMVVLQLRLIKKRLTLDIDTLSVLV